MALINKIEKYRNRITYKSNNNGSITFIGPYSLKSHKSDKVFNFPPTLNIDGFQSVEFEIKSIEELDELISTLNKHRDEMKSQADFDKVDSEWRKEMGVD